MNLRSDTSHFSLAGPGAAYSNQSGSEELIPDVAKWILWSQWTHEKKCYYPSPHGNANQKPPGDVITPQLQWLPQIDKQVSPPSQELTNAGKNAETRWLSHTVAVNMNEHSHFRSSAVFRRVQKFHWCIDTHVRSEGCLGKGISQDSGREQGQFKRVWWRSLEFSLKVSDIV